MEILSVYHLLANSELSKKSSERGLTQLPGFGYLIDENLLWPKIINKTEFITSNVPQVRCVIHHYVNMNDTELFFLFFPLEFG